MLQFLMFASLLVLAGKVIDVIIMPVELVVVLNFLSQALQEKQRHERHPKDQKKPMYFIVIYTVSCLDFLSDRKVGNKYFK